MTYDETPPCFGHFHCAREFLWCMWGRRWKLDPGAHSETHNCTNGGAHNCAHKWTDRDTIIYADAGGIGQQ
jgi:hypothetical protein